MKITIIFAVLIPVALGGAVAPGRCDSGDESGASIPVNLIVPSCMAPPCVLRKGHTYEVEVDFDVPRNTNNLTVKVTGIIDGLELPWNGVPVNGCDDILVGWCPMAAGDYWTYGVAIKVEPIYPSTPLIVKWQMRDDTGQAIWCFHLPAEITA
ncbi:Epididymal secretory protein E1 [Folsomia candida]|uniref:Epididymal secretory protein E1 n=2 Tax=Folsomia candida TaxID=158441 RepID=A0A226DTK0_FOLCA|nr:Epididymal secretory protein E1 [Folsomia candida]